MFLSLDFLFLASRPPHTHKQNLPKGAALHARALAAGARTRAERRLPHPPRHRRRAPRHLHVGVGEAGTRSVTHPTPHEEARKGDPPPAPYTHPSPTLHPPYAHPTPTLHPPYTHPTPTLHPPSTHPTPTLHPPSTPLHPTPDPPSCPYPRNPPQSPMNPPANPPPPPTSARRLLPVERSAHNLRDARRRARQARRRAVVAGVWPWGLVRLVFVSHPHPPSESPNEHLQVVSLILGFVRLVSFFCIE